MGLFSSHEQKLAKYITELAGKPDSQIEDNHGTQTLTVSVAGSQNDDAYNDIVERAVKINRNAVSTSSVDNHPELGNGLRVYSVHLKNPVYDLLKPELEKALAKAGKKIKIIPKVAAVVRSLSAFSKERMHQLKFDISPENMLIITVPKDVVLTDEERAYAATLGSPVRAEDGSTVITVKDTGKTEALKKLLTQMDIPVIAKEAVEGVARKIVPDWVTELKNLKTRLPESFHVFRVPRKDKPASIHLVIRDEASMDEITTSLANAGVRHNVSGVSAGIKAYLIKIRTENVDDLRQVTVIDQAAADVIGQYFLRGTGRGKDS